MIKTEEKRIRKLVLQNSKAKQAFEKMCDYFKIVDKLQATRHIILINYIYNGNPNELNNLSLCAAANVGERTCYRYREQYIECFYLCFEMLIGK